MRFEALETSLDLIRSLRLPATRLERRHPDLARQLRRAASSVPANLAEGRHRTGKDRLYHWRVAAGSAEEVRTTLRVAVAWGDFEEPQLAEALALLDRVLAMAWRLTH